MMNSSTPIIVMGASAGGVESLKEVVSGLSSDFPSPIFIVLHISPSQTSSLPELLIRFGPMTALHPEDGTKIKPGFIYVAPPDHHLLIEREGRIAIKRGPKENRFRPSIDALFRSAAYNYGARAIGVVLSGALDDGTSGLWSIKRLGGITVIQEPNDARFESMPKNALEYVNIDYNLPAKEIGALLMHLAHQDPMRPAQNIAVDPAVQALMEKEIQIACEGDAFNKGIMEIGTLTPFTCPECHGVLVKLTEGKMSRFRCHTGHAYTDSSLLEGVMESTGEMLWQVMRSLEEGVMVLIDMGRNLKNAGDPARAQIFFNKARLLQKQSNSLHETLLNHESLSGDNLGQPPEHSVGT